MKAGKKDEEGKLTTVRNLMYRKTGALNECRDDYDDALGLSRTKKKKERKKEKENKTAKRMIIGGWRGNALGRWNTKPRAAQHFRYRWLLNLDAP